MGNILKPACLTLTFRRLPHEDHESELDIQYLYEYVFNPLAGEFPNEIHLFTTNYNIFVL